MRPAGFNPNDTPGDQIGDGWAGRTLSPAGTPIFTTNRDPAIVDTDPLTETDAPDGTDTGFSAASERELLTGLFNGDFHVPPPDTTRPIVSDPNDADRNPLEGFYWYPPADGTIKLYWESTPTYASGGRLRFDLTNATSTSDGYLEFKVRGLGSRTQLWLRPVAGVWVSASMTGDSRVYVAQQALQSDLDTTGSSFDTIMSLTTLDAGLGIQTIYAIADGDVASPPQDAAYIRCRWGVRGPAAGTETKSVYLSEVFALNYPSRVYLPDDTNPTTQAPGYLYQAAGILRAVIGGSATSYSRILGPNIVRADVISPAQITAAQNDYNPTGLGTCSILRLSSDASRNITGITAQEDGRVLHIVNVGSFNINLMHQDAGSSAANRIIAPDGVSLIIAGGGGTTIWYDSTSSRWRSLSQRA